MDSALTLLAQAAAPDGDGGAGALLLGGGCMLVWMVVVLAALVLWIWALVDAIRNPALDNNSRLLWVLVIVLTNWIGAILYLLIGRKGRAGGV